MVERGTDRRTKPRLAIGMVAAVFAAGVVEVVALVNPWRHVYLMPLGHAVVAVAMVTAAPAVLGVAAWLAFRDRGLVRSLGVLAATVTVGVCFLGAHWVAVVEIAGGEPAFPPTVVAVSPGDAFELVLVSYSGFMGGHDILRIRSRVGPFSREPTQDLACFGQPFDSLGPEDTFASAAFRTDHEVEVRTEVCPAWTTSFDRGSLLAETTVNHGCE